MDNNHYRLNVLSYFLKNQFQNENIELDKEMSRIKIENKWETLIHNGVKFPEEYEQKNIQIIYDGKDIFLSKKAEEDAFLYAKYIDTEYVTNSIFRKNFFNDWRKSLGKDHVIQLLNLCDFSKMKEYIIKEKEKKKDKQTDEDNKYKIVIVDGKQQNVSNYRMEPPGIFIGRGKNPHLGKIKKRIYPEDVTINISKDVPIPDTIIGHKWGKIIHDKSVEWLASWKDTITGKTKYLWLSAHSDMKANNDQKKFDLARKLKRKIMQINDENERNMKSSDSKIRQIATALFFIDKLAIRVGNEKAEDETDTVGVTNLRVEHIELGENNKITLSFLGKDSVPYINTINVDDIVYNNVKGLIQDKSKNDQIFDQITSNDVNKYLQKYIINLTAKVFRTYNASNLFQKELRKITKRYEGMGGQEKAILDDFIKANAKVAKMMNHQKNVTTGYKKNLDKVNETIKKLKKQLSKAKKIKKNVTIEKIKNKIKNYKSKKEIVKEMKNISLGTSKANYIDPRITAAFMKKHKLDINKLFSKTLQEKFRWAFEIDENYKF